MTSKNTRRSGLRKKFHQGLRRLFAGLPVGVRFGIYRRMVDCDPAPDQQLQLSVAQTREDLEGCFRLLHDAYVASGFMKPHPSGMRITKYHALPTTTTLCAKYGDRVVGTISMIREGVFGFPLQSIFDLDNVRAAGGKIAEISALAVHPDFRKTGGAILFPLMKLMYEYSTKYFDTRHLVIAVNPDKIELYESLLFFKRLNEKVVDNYDFANGAPAVGATLDLSSAADLFERVYGRRAPRKNLHYYFVKLVLANIRLPQRRYFTTNDPVLTPEILDYFFNQRSDVFAELDDRPKALLWSIYDQPEYRRVLPMLKGSPVEFHALRRHQRFSLRCPAQLTFKLLDGEGERRAVMTVTDVSLLGFQASTDIEIPLGINGTAMVELGVTDKSELEVKVLRRRQGDDASYYVFTLTEPDQPWRRVVSALETASTAGDL